MKELTTKQIALYSALATAAVEAVTVLFRFGLKMESTRDTASTIGRLTGGVRIHHGYVGAVAILVALAVMGRYPALARWVLVAGAALLASDLIHHFLVLWPITGSPEFDLVYPGYFG